MIELRHLQKQYPQSMPLKDICTTIREGDVISVIGPSGCGKSTLLRCINMLDPPTGGEILLNGENITARGYNLNKLRLKVGMVFQSYHLFGHQTVIENVMRPQMKLLGRSKQEAYDKAYALLSVVGLATKQFQFPEQMSGGQQQRVAIARALAMDPEILLFDEPTSALDPTMVGEVEAVIHDLAKKGTTMMLVTHDMKFARNVSNRVFYLDEGIIYEDGPPEQIFGEPKREKTRQFIHGMSSLKIEVKSGEFDFPKAISDIERFCLRQDFDARVVHKLQMILEELCAIYFPAKKGTDFNAEAVLECRDGKKAVTLTVRHNAGIVTQKDLAGDLSFAIVRRMAEELRQRELEEDDAKYGCEMVLTVRGEEGPAHES